MNITVNLLNYGEIKLEGQIDFGEEGIIVVTDSKIYFFTYHNLRWVSYVQNSKS